jgi:hypothetical protein
MREGKVRLSFDIPESEHIILKTACVQAKLSIKDFAHAMILKGIQDLNEEQFKKRLKESIQQSKEGKRRVINIDELEKMFSDEDE